VQGVMCLHVIAHFACLREAASAKAGHAGVNLSRRMT
jgi:hypothetical protein